MKKKILFIVLCLLSQWTMAQKEAPKWVDKAKKAVFSVVLTTLTTNYSIPATVSLYRKMEWRCPTILCLKVQHVQMLLTRKVNRCRLKLFWV